MALLSVIRRWHFREGMPIREIERRTGLSGHSATAAAMALSLALVFPRLRALFVTAGVLICVSRQLVGMHWMSDTLTGWAVGAAFTYWLAHAFARRGLMFRYDDFGRLRPRRTQFAPTRFFRRSALRSA